MYEMRWVEVTESRMQRGGRGERYSLLFFAVVFLLFGFSFVKGPIIFDNNILRCTFFGHGGLKGGGEYIFKDSSFVTTVGSSILLFLSDFILGF